MSRPYFGVEVTCKRLQTILKAMKIAFIAEGKSTNLKVAGYTPSEGEIFRELEPVISELISTDEVNKQVGPVMVERIPDSDNYYLFKIDFALGILKVAKDDLVKREQLTIQDGFAALADEINSIDEDSITEDDRERLIGEAEKLGVIWKKPLDEYELFEINEVIAFRKLALKQVTEKPLIESDGDELIHLASKIGIPNDKVDATKTDDELRELLESELPPGYRWICKACEPKESPQCNNLACDAAKEFHAQKMLESLECDSCEERNAGRCETPGVVEDCVLLKSTPAQEVSEKEEFKRKNFKTDCAYETDGHCNISGFNNPSLIEDLSLCQAEGCKTYLRSEIAHNPTSCFGSPASDLDENEENQPEGAA